MNKTLEHNHLHPIKELHGIALAIDEDAKLCIQQDVIEEITRKWEKAEDSVDKAEVGQILWKLAWQDRYIRFLTAMCDVHADKSMAAYQEYKIKYGLQKIHHLGALILGVCLTITYYRFFR